MNLVGLINVTEVNKFADQPRWLHLLFLVIHRTFPGIKRNYRLSEKYRKEKKKNKKPRT